MPSSRFAGIALAAAIAVGLGACARENRYDRGPIVRTLEVLDSLKRSQPEHRAPLRSAQLPVAPATADSDSVELVRIGGF